MSFSFHKHFHISFIVDNSLGMLQKTSTNELTIFDQVKNSLETVLKAYYRNLNVPIEEVKEYIHLFVTSSTEPLSTYETNHEAHVMHQVKNLECTAANFLTEVIESALFHVGKFRCLNESETFLGYRDGAIFEPALIFYLTSQPSARQIQKLNRSIEAKKLHVRSEYKIVTIKYCSPSPQQHPTNMEKFKQQVQKSRQSLMLQQVMKRINGELVHTCNQDEMCNAIQSRILGFKPTLSMGLTIKQYKIHNKQLSRIQFPSVKQQQQYVNALKTITNDISSFLLQPTLPHIFLQTLPNQYNTSTMIPLPQEITAKHLITQNNNMIVIDEFEGLRFFVDFMKEYTGELDNVSKYLFNMYHVQGTNAKLNALCKDFTTEKKFPVFFQRKQQYLIGYLLMHFPSQSGKPNTQPLKPSFQLHFSFSNFPNLSANLRSYRQRNPSCEQYFQNYISTLPIFYHKFLKHYLSNLNLKFTPQTEQLWENINSKPIGVTNLRCYEQRLAEKRNLMGMLKSNVEEHQRYMSQCCSVYSGRFYAHEQDRSRHYDFRTNAHNSSAKNSLLSKYFANTLTKLSNFKSSLQIYDYMTLPDIQSQSMKKQQEKYNIRRNDDEMDELVGDLLGNPFRKINKKVKVHDQAESVWVGEDDIMEMKEMLSKEVEVFYGMGDNLDNEDRESMEIVLKLDNVYDRLAGVKEILASVVKKIEQKQKLAKISQPTQNMQNTEKQKVLSQNDEQQIQQQLNPVKYSENKQNQQIFTQFQTQQSTQHFQAFSPPSSQQNEPSFTSLHRTEFDKNVQLVPQPEPQEQQIFKNKMPELLEQISSKFALKKPAILQIPGQIFNNERYLKNKAVFDAILKGKK